MAKKVADKGTKISSRTFVATTDTARIGRMVDDVLRRGSKVMDDMHITCVSILLCALEHRNVDHATRLFNGLGGGFRRSAVAQWMQHYGPFDFSKEKDKEKYPAGGKFKFNANTHAAILEVYKKDKARFTKELKTFWDLNPEKPFTGFDLKAMLDGLIKRADSVIEKHGDDASAKDKINVKGLEPLKKLLATL